MAETVTDRKGMSRFRDGCHKTGAALRKPVSFAALRFDGLGGRQLPISVWLGAWGACM